LDEILTRGEVVPHDVALLSKPPGKKVFEYPSMWAYGNHFRCKSELWGSTHSSYDVGVAFVILQEYQSSVHDVNWMEAQLKYVGILRKIMSVDFSSLRVNIMKYQWYQPDVMGRATMIVDEYGFWKVKDYTFQDLKTEPYIMPANASQVCLKNTKLSL
jgi:hypothetical protein